MGFSLVFCENLKRGKILKMREKIIFVGGGSGGHIFPAIAIAEKLPKKFEKIFIVSRAKLDAQILQKTDFKFHQIFSGKWRRYFSFANFFDIFKIALGFAQ